MEKILEGILKKKKKKNQTSLKRWLKQLGELLVLWKIRVWFLDPKRRLTTVLPCSLLRANASSDSSELLHEGTTQTLRHKHIYGKYHNKELCLKTYKYKFCPLVLLFLTLYKDKVIGVGSCFDLFHLIQNFANSR